MTTLHNNMSGSDAVAAINANLQEIGSNVTVSNTDAATLCAALNGVFADYDDITLLTESMSGSEFVAAVNANFAAAAEQQDEPSNAKMKFLHISDTHGYTDSFTECISRLSAVDSDIDHLLITGDMTNYGNSNYNYAVSSLDTIKAMGDRLLMCPGNHDTYDNTHSGYGGKADQVCETAWLHNYMGNNVIWGDTNGNDNVPITAGYWYKDIVKEEKTLRIISLDQYEIGNNYYSAKYNTVYSQEQVDWLLDLLFNTPSSYYIIIMMHEPAVQSPAASQPSDHDDVAASMAACNLFTSELLEHFGNRRNEPSLNLLPKIMRAYMHKENLSFSYDNKDNKGNHGTLTVAKDFRNHTPATFLFYIGGHQHEDICGYIPYNEWSDQLMLFVPAGDVRVPYGMCDDLAWNYNGYVGQKYASDEPDYRINEVTLDFGSKTITVKRIGNKTTALYNSTGGAVRPHGGRVRDEITFPFKKN